MSQITPFLWFDDKAEEAARFYTSVFNNSMILKTTRYGKDGAAVSGRPKGLYHDGRSPARRQEFVALNGGPPFHFTEAVSFVVDCQTQKEVDRYWQRLSEGGQEIQCGWLKDK